MYDLPSYVWALVLAGAIGIPAATCAMLYRSAVAVGVGRRTATAVTATTATVLGGWLVVSHRHPTRGGEVEEGSAPDLAKS